MAQSKAAETSLTRSLLVLLCAAAGGAAGYSVFFYLARRGYYGLILPGGLAGIAAGIMRSRSMGVALACGAVAALAGLITEFRYAPFVANPGFGFFLSHIGDLQPVTLGMIALGGVIGF